MPDDRTKFYAASFVFLLKDKQVFLLRRANTGWRDGDYDVPAGHVEPNETSLEAAVREAREESTVSIDLRDLRFAHTVARYAAQSDGSVRIYADYCFTAENWTGTARVGETHKADRGEWFPLNRIPDNMTPYTRQALQLFQEGKFYSEYGWEDVKKT